MKIFISHSSKNKNYGEALVDLLTGVGISADRIIFTSNDAHGIPTGTNIFDWLKSRIVEKPHVLYLLSPEYYSSVACLNEMGAAWVVENAHTMMFTPDFNLDCYEFQNGVLDPREIGFFVNNEDRLVAFIDSLKEPYGISVNAVVIYQKIKAFLKSVNSIETPVVKAVSKPVVRTMPTVAFELNEPAPYNHEMAKLVKKNHGKSRFTSDLLNNKLEGYEVLLAYYVIDNGRFKLRSGWQLGHEIEDIKAWEDVNELRNLLSLNYEKALKRFEMRRLIEVSDVTSSGNPKEFILIKAFQEELLDQSKEVEQLIKVVVDRNRQDEPFPF
ncbi:MAG: toll/interleukin-1 receptor domain-containing protein [Flavobacteriales bacterium]